MSRQTGPPRGIRVALLAAFAVLLAAAPTVSTAATKTVDLDAQTANGAESQCDLNVLSTFPVKVENVVTNKAVGNTFDFSWKSAGPGGFTSSATAGSTGGVGAKWTWTTNQTVYSFTGNNCENDICFLRTSGPDSITSVCNASCVDDGATLTISKGATADEVVLSWTGGAGPYTVYRSTNRVAIDQPANQIASVSTTTYTDRFTATGATYYKVRGASCNQRKSCSTNADCNPANEGTCVSRGPFSVPGRSLFTNDVTVSSASLTSSLITFFSPPTEVFRVTSTAFPGSIQETLTNNSADPVTVVSEAFPPGCCPGDPATDHKLRCGEVCVDYLSDPNNCGACGNVCGDGTCCSNGNCVSLCADGQIWCNGVCVDPSNDPGNCGTCGNACGEGSCCSGGACVAEDACYAGEAFCDGLCRDLQNDNNHCGACGSVCGEGSCCSEGDCVSVCPEGKVWCNGACVDVANDSDNCGACGNVCGEGSCCSNGSCSAFDACEAGRTLCGSLCYDLQNDPNHCGACGNVCPSDSTCSNGLCSPCPGQGGRKDACDNRCVNLNTDPNNCGACGNSCNVGCPSGYKGDCSNGRSCRCVEGTPVPPPPSNIPPPTNPFCSNPNPDPVPVAGACPNPNVNPSPTPGFCPNPIQSGPAPGACPDPGPPAPEVEETPICTALPVETTIPAGGSLTTCRPSGLVFREIAQTVSVCGDTIPGPDGTCGDGVSNVSTGTFMRLVPATDIEVGDAYLTPFSVIVTGDSTGDGMIQPGETAKLQIGVLNAGPVPVVGAQATLVSAPVDLTDDGIDNPLGVTVTNGTNAYGTIAGTPPPVDCIPITPQPSVNLLKFTVALPPEHPGDVARRFDLLFTGTVNGAPFTATMPVAVGIADRCVPEEATRDFDGVLGLLEPLAKLVPSGDPVPYPATAFVAGSPLPMSLRLWCGNRELDDTTVDPPQIVAIHEQTRGALDLSQIVINDDTGTSDPTFYFGGDETRTYGPWNFNLRTDQLGTGRFTVTIRIANRKEYVAGFELQ